MAETYLTPTFQNATKPPAAPAPAAAAPATQAPAPAQTGGEQYQTDTFKKAVAPQQTPDGGQQQTTGAQPSGWGIDWSKGGQVTMPQSVQDWSTIAAQNSLMGLYPGLNAQADAARKRLDPLTAASADITGNIASPTTLLNAVPVVGPELAGGLHEGIKSATNWSPGESWGDYLKRVGEDAAGGVAGGVAGHGAAKLAPKVLPQLTEWGLKAGPVGYGTKLMHDYLGNVGADVATGVGLFGLVDKASKWAGEQAGKAASSPLTQQAIKSLILGGGSAARTGAGPYDQWFQ